MRRPLVAPCSALGARFIIRRMRAFCLRIAFVITTAVLIGCADGPAEFTADNPGGYFHQISTEPSEIFRNKVDHEAALEARGVEPPVGSATWRDFWMKMIAYWSSPEGAFGHREVASYITQQRRARGLAPL